MKRRSRRYVLIPVFCLALAACGGGDSSPAAPAAPQVDASGSLLPDCSGCGAVNATTYDAGLGVGIWRYSNDSSSAATLNINIAGVAAGKVATLIFSNGSPATASAPSSGVLASPVAASAVRAETGRLAGTAAEQAGHDDAHAQMLEKNRAVASGLMRSRTTIQAARDLASSLPGVARLSFSPAEGTPRTWIDNFPETPVSHETVARAVCRLPTGRNVVWWVELTSVSSGKLTDAAFAAMQASYCVSGSDKSGLARLNILLGDVWGPAPPEAIQDASGALQDVNVVILNVPDAQWAGYFFACNNVSKGACTKSSPKSISNQALVFFINVEQIRRDLNFATSTLMHESTHMVNFYQRAVVQGVAHDTWLEETSAMMTEDIVAPAVINGGYNKIKEVRLPDYLRSGGNVSYVNWPTLVDSSSHYGIGGAFGAFLNRRYGLSIYQQLVTSCRNGPATSTAAAQTSYDCLDGLIKANKGVGFSDEFARFGTTVFGQLSAARSPAGYGYPSVQAGDYALQANDLTASRLAAAPAALASGYTATTQTYQRDTISAGKTSYARNGLAVPARTVLTLVIQ